jgi:hypothetical protein
MLRLKPQQFDRQKGFLPYLPYRPSTSSNVAYVHHGLVVVTQVLSACIILSLAAFSLADIYLPS